MEACLSHIKTQHFCSPLSIPKTKHSSIPSHPTLLHQIPLGDGGLRLRRRWRKNGQFSHGLSRSVVGCVKWGTVSELEDEMNLDEEWIGIGRWGENCKGREGIVELMECLEREAIMGEDEGREPADYIRRAHIFDKSSRVFQALQQSNAAPDS